MKPSLNPYKEYQSNQISTAEPKQLIIMLYDGAVRFLESAAQFMGDFRMYDKANNNLLRAQDIITELMVSLDLEKGGEVAQNLLNLYAYMKKQLLDANLKKSAAEVEKVIAMLKDLRIAWDQADPARSMVGVNKPVGLQSGFTAQG